jgi:serine phosphatase RsbU (regulator of sigma subunit)/anti-sigma regulatory factor (Ser/Thr protein kinase)/CHASE3 domain sensor protein
MRFGIRPQVLLLALVPALALVVLLALSTMLVRQTEQRNVASEELLEALRLSETVWNDLADATRSAQHYIEHGNESELAGYRIERGNLPADVARFNATVDRVPDLRGPGRTYSQQALRGLDLIASVIDAYRRGGITEARRVASSPYSRRYGDQLQRDKIAFDHAAQPRTLQAINTTRAAQRDFERAIVFVALGGLVLTLFVALLFAVGIVRRLSALGDNARRLAFGLPTIPVSGNDELNELDRLYHEMADRIRTAQVQLSENRDTISLLQQALLPALPDIPGLQLDSAYATPAAGPEIGGDWFDAFELPGGLVGLSIGDITGHGLRAAAMMAFVRRTIRILAWRDPEPQVVMEHMNAVLCHFEPDTLATAFFAIFDVESGELRYTLAGHGAPLVAQSDDQVRILEGEGLLLGLRETTRYATYQDRLSDGDRLVLYTDGLIEIDRDYGAGLEQLERAIRDELAAPSDNLAEGIQHRVLGDRTPHDDAALLVVSYVGARERPSAVGDAWNFDARREDAARRVKSEFMSRLALLGPRAPDPAVAQIIFGELLSNAVQHAPGPVRLELAVRDGRVVLAIEDQNPAFPQNGSLHPQPPQWDAERGRGLFLISTLCPEIRIVPTREGKVTTVVLPER